MAVLLQLRNAEKSYGDQLLLDDAECTIYEDNKVGFIGRNGAGKSTLLRVLIGEEELDSGEVIRSPNLRIGYLKQHDPFLPGESAMEFFLRDSEQPDWKCGEVAGQFEIKGQYLDGPISALSGGWQTRVKLAALLLHEPNLLVLDEPTNFLDLRTQLLLENFLKGFNQACLIVSHDRAFLEATCEHTLSLARGELTMYPGKVNAFLEYDEERKEHDERVNAAIIAKQKQLQQFIDKNKARATTASRAKSREKQLEKLQTIEIAADAPRAHIRCPIVDPRQGPCIRTKDLAIGYNGHAVAKEIDLEIEHGERVAIVGDNGQGKTTLLRTLVESLEPIDGNVKWGYACNVGVYAQHVYHSLPPDQTIQQYLEYESKPGTTTQEILAAAGAMLFRDAHVKKKIKVLSGGERARVCMTGLLLGDYNILVLDEPGNHLDVETIDALMDGLDKYQGTVIFTTHDRHFLKRMATSILEVRDGRVRNYGEGYDAYLYRVNKEIEEGARDLSPRKSGGPPPLPAETAKAPKPTGNEERQLRRELSNIEKQIAKLDDRKKAVNKELLSTTDAEAAMKLHEELTDITNQLSECEDRWLELQEILGEV
ncbi:MAG: ABC-F family ATP-binding cassette domain-containing protein [Planctomycetaceae bacterium]|nr:ABC-F family ATP-binding cassette domain-containing protein [Planctomycetaceae bacterium]